VHLIIGEDGVVSEKIGSMYHVTTQAIEIPPHGRCIDADRLAAAVAQAQDSVLHKEYDPFMLLGDVLRWIGLAPTILEASE
jgi:hypothetical protein